MSSPNYNYACYISFHCPECNFVIAPSDFGISVINPNLHGVSLEQAYRDGYVTQQTVQTILTKEFECAMPHRPVRPPWHCESDLGRERLARVIAMSLSLKSLASSLVKVLDGDLILRNILFHAWHSSSEWKSGIIRFLLQQFRTTNSTREGQ